MDKIEIIRILKDLKAELNEHTKLKGMYLFGSYAYNNQRKDSDIAIAIVVEKIEGDYLKFLSLIWFLSSKYDSRIEPVVFQENQPDHSGFFNSIQQTGIEIN